MKSVYSGKISPSLKDSELIEGQVYMARFVSNSASGEPLMRLMNNNFGILKKSESSNTSIRKKANSVIDNMMATGHGNKSYLVRVIKKPNKRGYYEFLPAVDGQGSQPNHGEGLTEILHREATSLISFNSSIHYAKCMYINRPSLLYTSSSS